MKCPPRAPLTAALTIIALIAGCADESPLERSGVSLRPPTGWDSVASTTWAVPGRSLAAWRGPEGASLVVYRTLPIPDGSVAMLADEQVNRLANLPGLTDLKRQLLQVAGREAARIEALAPGTGDALAASGLGKPVAPKGKALIPTRRIVVAVPEPSATFWFAWHFPDAARARISPQVDAALQTVQIKQTSSPSSY